MSDKINRIESKIGNKVTKFNWNKQSLHIDNTTEAAEVVRGFEGQNHTIRSDMYLLTPEIASVFYLLLFFSTIFMITTGICIMH